jgi:hypothetical protein
MAGPSTTAPFQLKTYIFNKGVFKWHLPLNNKVNLISQIASQEITNPIYQANEEARKAHELAMEQRRAKLEVVRLAKETLIENDRNKPTGERGITASDVTAFADTLNNYINQ